MKFQTSVPVLVEKTEVDVQTGVPETARQALIAVVEYSEIAVDFDY